jgi:UPF0271 protein
VQATIDLNCDLGEGAGHDAELMPWITSANIACGAHAGDLRTMIDAVECAADHGVAVGAHPGYFDLENFGRAERDVSPDEAARLVVLQMEQFFEVAGAAMRHVKLHGALYNQVSRDARLAEAVAGELSRLWPGTILFALAGSPLARIARARGLRVAEEFFADRSYEDDGTLTPRTQRHALLTAPKAVAERVVRLAREGTVETTGGTVLRIAAETVCLHGDSPKAVTLARRLRTELKKAGIAVAPVRSVTDGRAR